jgi:EmrB/QacA subfamily drug resistance transporter
MASTAYGGTAPAATPFSIRAILAPLVAIILGAFMVILDNTVVNVALPTLVNDFKSDLHTLQWVLTGYMLAQAAVVPLAGWLSDRFGAKRVFLVAVTLFTLGSALCATAQSAGMLIVFRLLQGLGGGCVMPIGMAFVYRLSPPDKRGTVMGTLGIPILFAPALGPTISGWLVQYADWRWIFLINVPVGAIALLLGVRRLPDVSRQMVAGLDLWGMILGPLAFASLSYGINEGATSWTSANTLAGLIGGAVLLAAFVVAELRAAQPLLELRVFRSVDFSLAIVVQWITGIALFGGVFLLPLFLQQVRNFGAFDTGRIMMAQAIASAILMPIGGRLFDKIGARPLAVVGLGLVTVGTYMLTSLSATTSGGDLILSLILRGAGMGMMMMSVNTHLLNAAPRKLVGRVTSLTQALQNVVNSLAIAGLSTVITSRPSYQTAMNLIAQAKQAHPHAPAPAALPSVIANLFAAAFNDAMKLVVVAGIAGILLAFTLRRNLAAQQADAPAGVPQESAAALEMAG